MKVTKIAQAVRKQPSSLCATWLDTAFSAKQFAQSTKGHASTKKRGVKTMLTNELQATEAPTEGYPQYEADSWQSRPSQSSTQTDPDRKMGKFAAMHDVRAMCS